MDSMFPKSLEPCSYTSEGGLPMMRVKQVLRWAETLGSISCRCFHARLRMSAGDARALCVVLGELWCP